MDARQGCVSGEHRVAGREASADQIERDIHRTRSRMDEIADAIQDRLSVRALGGHFVDMLTAGAGVGSRRAIRGIRENPVPAMLTGLAIAWLVADRAYSRRAPAYDEGTEHGADPTRRADGSTIGKAVHGVGETVRAAAHKAGDVASAARHQVTAAVSAAGEKASELGGKVRDTAAAAGEGVSMAAHRAKEVAERAGRMAVDAYDENPLVIGLAAFALGLVGGVAVPTTRAENRLMGRASRAVKDRAMEAGSQAVQTGKRMAAKAAEAAQASATEPGTAPDAGGRLANVIEAAAGAAAGEVRQAAGDIPGREEPDRRH